MKIVNFGHVVDGQVFTFGGKMPLTFPRPMVPENFEGNPNITAAEWGLQCRRARNIARSIGYKPAIGYMVNRGASNMDAHRSVGYSQWFEHPDAVEFDDIPF